MTNTSRLVHIPLPARTGIGFRRKQTVGSGRRLSRATKETAPEQEREEGGTEVGLVRGPGQSNSHHALHER